MSAEIITTNQTSQYAIGITSFVTLMPGVSLTVAATTDPGFLANHDGNCTLTVLGDVVTFGSGVVIGSAVTSTALAAVTVGEDGLVQSLTDIGVDMRRSGATLDNDGVISGGNAGVSYAAGVEGAKVTNAGTISSLLGSGIVVNGATGGGTPGLFQLVNTGTIEGATNGVTIGKESLVLTNHGDIIGLANGISLTDDPTLDNLLTLVNTGLIQGDTAAIAATGHADSVTNTGTLAGAVQLSDGDNRFDNSGAVIGAVTAGTGNDSFTNGATGTISGAVDLGAGANTVSNQGQLTAGLTLGAGDDALRNDGTIFGALTLGDGTNTARIDGLVTGDVTGGENADTLVVRGRIEGGLTLAGGSDVLKIGGRIEGDIDMGSGTDSLRLWSGAQALTGTLDGGTGSDTLLSWIDVEDVFNFEEIHLKGTASLRAVGDAIANTIYGNMRDNEIDGGDGTDTLWGRGGSDTLLGGLAADTIVGGRGADTLVGGEGADSLRGGQGRDIFVYEAETDSRKSAPDMILDFQRGRDKIDLSDLVDGTFGFIAKKGFSGDGTPEINYKQRDGYAEVRVDLDGDGGFEMRIEVHGVEKVTAGDFLL